MIKKRATPILGNLQMGTQAIMLKVYQSPNNTVEM